MVKPESNAKQAKPFSEGVLLLYSTPVLDFWPRRRVITRLPFQCIVYISTTAPIWLAICHGSSSIRKRKKKSYCTVWCGGRASRRAVIIPIKSSAVACGFFLHHRFFLEVEAAWRWPRAASRQRNSEAGAHTPHPASTCTSCKASCGN